MIESVSVSSYIGLLASLKDAAYRKIYSSIMAVEARHSSFIRANLGEQPFPSSFDTPVDLDELNTLVQLFAVSCPQKNPLALRYAFSCLPCHSRTNTSRADFSNALLILQQSRSHWQKSHLRHLRQTHQSGFRLRPLYAAFLTLTGPVFAPAKRLPDNSGFNVTVLAAPEGFAPLMASLMWSCRARTQR